MPIEFTCKKFDNLSPKDLYAIFGLRIAVFMMEQDCLYQEVDGKDPKCWHLMAWDDDVLVGYARIVPPGVSYAEPSFGRLVTTETYRSKKLGKALMTLILQFLCNFHPEETIRISAQTYLINFYRKFGFETVGEEYLEDLLPHIEMRKTLN